MKERRRDTKREVERVSHRGKESECELKGWGRKRKAAAFALPVMRCCLG